MALKILYSPILRLGVVQDDTNRVAIGIAPVFRLVLIEPSAVPPPPTAKKIMGDGLTWIMS
jgi:hypothetical protein